MLRFRCLCAAAGLLLAAGAEAQTYRWHNVVTYPDDVMKTGDGWSAVRIEDQRFTSYRCAADDFVLDKPTRITRIMFYGVPLGDPWIVGGDWYIYADAGGRPGALLAAGPNTPLDRQLAGFNNNSFGPVYTNSMKVDVSLPAGRYFLGFRTFQDFNPNGEKNTQGALSTRTAIGNARAFWSFGVRGDGTVTDPWVLLDQFNLEPNNEWAFLIEGEVESGCYADCDQNGRLDIRDFFCFQAAFAARDAYADCDNNSLFDIRDFFCYQTQYAQGCQ